MRIEFSPKAEKKIAKMIKKVAKEEKISVDVAQRNILDRILGEFDADTIVVRGKKK